MSTARRLGRAGITAAALLAAAALLSACGGSTTEGGTDGEAAAGSGGAFPRTVEHAMGSTEIPERPERILALDRGFSDAALALDATLVGYTTFTSTDAPLPEYLTKGHKENLAEAQNVGLLSEPKAELIAKAQPDLILSAKVRHEQGYEQLSQVAPTVFSETTGATWKENLLLAGKAMGKKDRAEQLISDFETRAQQIGEAIKEKEGELPTVSVVRFAGDAEGVRLYSRNSFIGVLMDDLGLPSPEGQKETEDIVTYHSPERLLDLDADQIFVATYDDGSSDAVEKDKEKYTSSPLWGELEGEKHEVNDSYWISGVGIIAANKVLDDVAETFEVDPAKSA